MCNGIRIWPHCRYQLSSKGSSICQDQTHRLQKPQYDLRVSILQGISMVGSLLLCSFSRIISILKDVTWATLKPAFYKQTSLRMMLKKMMQVGISSHMLNIRNFIGLFCNSSIQQASPNFCPSDWTQAQGKLLTNKQWSLYSNRNPCLDKRTS